MEEDRVPRFLLRGRITPTKVGQQTWSYPDLSFLIWKPVILPESLDFED